MHRALHGGRRRSAAPRTSPAANGSAPASTPFSAGRSPAVWHAQRCLDHCEAAGISDWDLAYAYEALARASSLAGDVERAASWRERARAAGDAIVDSEDREHFDEDFATL